MDGRRMPSAVDQLKNKATRDLITWTIATLAAILTLVGTFLALVHPSSKDKTSAATAAAPARAGAGSTQANTAKPGGVSADGGSVAIGGSVTGSTITAGGSPPAKPAR